MNALRQAYIHSPSLHEHVAPVLCCVAQFPGGGARITVRSTLAMLIKIVNSVSPCPCNWRHGADGSQSMEMRSAMQAHQAERHILQLLRPFFPKRTRSQRLVAEREKWLADTRQRLLGVNILVIPPGDESQERFSFVVDREGKMVGTATDAEAYAGCSPEDIVPILLHHKSRGGDEANSTENKSIEVAIQTKQFLRAITVSHHCLAEETGLTSESREKVVTFAIEHKLPITLTLQRKVDHSGAACALHTYWTSD
eukprot:gene13717-biopygen8670